MRTTKYSYITSYQYYQWGEKSAQARTQFSQTFRRVLEERIPEDMNVTLSNLEFRVDDRLLVELEGKTKDDLKFVSNILKEITGETFDSNNVPKRKGLFGTLRAVGKVGFGVFVDVGIESPAKEVLIPLHRLRTQLAGDNTLSTREICKKYGFMDYFPVEIEIDKILFEKGGKPKFEGKFTDDFLDQIAEFVNSGLDIVFTTGVSRQMVKKTIAKRGHTIDVPQIIRIGPLETACVCAKGTNAPGIVSHIGPFLSNCRFSMIRPAQLTRYWK